MPSMLEVLAAEVARIKAEGEAYAEEQKREDEEFNAEIARTFKAIVMIGYALLFILPFGILQEISRHEYQQSFQLVTAWGVSYASLCYTRWTGRNRGWLKPPIRILRWLSLSACLSFILRHTLLRGMSNVTDVRSLVGSESKPPKP